MLEPIFFTLFDIASKRSHLESTQGLSQADDGTIKGVHVIQWKAILVGF